MAHVSILIAFDSSYFLVLIYLVHYTSRANQDVFPHIFLIQLFMHILAASQMEHYAEHSIWIFLLFQECVAAAEFYSSFSKT